MQASVVGGGGKRSLIHFRVCFRGDFAAAAFEWRIVKTIKYTSHRGSLLMSLQHAALRYKRERVVRGVVIGRCTLSVRPSPTKHRLQTCSPLSTCSSTPSLSKPRRRGSGCRPSLYVWIGKIGSTLTMKCASWGWAALTRPRKHSKSSENEGKRGRISQALREWQLRLLPFHRTIASARKLSTN